MQRARQVDLYRQTMGRVWARAVCVQGYAVLWGKLAAGRSVFSIKGLRAPGSAPPKQDPQALRPSPLLARKVSEVEIAAAFIRHISQARIDEFFARVTTEPSHRAGVAMTMRLRHLDYNDGNVRKCELGQSRAGRSPKHRRWRSWATWRREAGGDASCPSRSRRILAGFPGESVRGNLQETTMVGEANAHGGRVHALKLLYVCGACGMKQCRRLLADPLVEGLTA